MNADRQRQLGEVGAACWLVVKKKKNKDDEELK